jgi:adenylylsulfate kinase
MVTKIDFDSAQMETANRLKLSDIIDPRDKISGSLTGTVKNTGKNIFFTRGKVSLEDRERRNQHQSYILWLTGLSGSGKTTLARELERILFERGYQVIVLDGDNVRHGLCSDLGFSREDRTENIRRIREIAKLIMQAGMIPITAFISPYREDRNQLRESLPPGKMIEIYLKCPLEECERRDVKGLYKKARAGIIKNFTGIDDPFEPPENPEIAIDTKDLTVSESVQAILDYLREGRYL